jgi:hypothetical protein
VSPYRENHYLEIRDTPDAQERTSQQALSRLKNLCQVQVNEQK